MINKELAKARGLSEETINKIQSIQDLQDKCLEESKELTDKYEIIWSFQTWIGLSRHLQDLWGFERNEDYIRFWEHPHCSCPCIDNEDNYPTGYYYKSNKCIIHGKG